MEQRDVAGAAGEDGDDDRVPLFGTWRNAYLAVIVAALACLAAVAAFERWSF